MVSKGVIFYFFARYEEDFRICRYCGRVRLCCANVVAGSFGHGENGKLADQG